MTSVHDLNTSFFTPKFGITIKNINMAKGQNDVVDAIRQICEEKNIAYESVIETVEAAISVAYRKDYGEKTQNIKVNYDAESGKMKVFDLKEVVEDTLYEEFLKEEEERQKRAEEIEKNKAAGKEEEIKKPEIKKEEIKKVSKDSNEEEEEIIKFNPKTMMALSQAKEIKKSYKIGDEVKIDLPVKEDFGRVAAQTAKQVIVQKIREAEREVVFQEYKDKEGEILVGTVQRVEGKTVLVDLGHTTAVMPPMEQVYGETYSPGQRIKVYLVSTSIENRGPEVLVSRAHSDILEKLFMTEVPEINSGLIEIKAVAREAGQRSKIAVFTDDENIDPIGSCVGQRGARIQTIINELGGEKVDIIEWDEKPEKFIENALSPAKVINIEVNEKEQTAKVFVEEDQLSLAIGKSGQNVRLAAKLTGWKIDILEEGAPAKKKEKKDDKKEDKEDNKEKSEEPRKDKPAKKETKKKAKKEEKKSKK